MGKRQIRISKDIKGTGLLTAVLRTSAESPPPSLWEILTQRCPHLSHSHSPHPHLPLLFFYLASITSIQRLGSWCQNLLLLCLGTQTMKPSHSCNYTWPGEYVSLTCLAHNHLPHSSSLSFPICWLHVYPQGNHVSHIMRKVRPLRQPWPLNDYMEQSTSPCPHYRMDIFQSLLPVSHSRAFELEIDF